MVSGCLLLYCRCKYQSRCAFVHDWRMQASELMGASLVQFLLHAQDEQEVYEPATAGEATEWASACASVAAMSALQHPHLHAYAYANSHASCVDSTQAHVDGLSSGYLSSLPRHNKKRLAVFEAMCP